MGRLATLVAFVTIACSSPTSPPRDGSRVEVAIERELGARVGVPIRVRCVWFALACNAFMPDGARLHVRLVKRAGGVEWQLDGALVRADDLEQYLRDALADLGKPQAVRCGARIQTVGEDGRVQCQLGQGGKAFVVVHADGTTSTEIVTDPVAGAARSEPVTIERDSTLLEMSKKLEHGEEDAEE